MKKISYEIPMQITAYLTEGNEIEIYFKAGKHGIVARKNLLTDITMTRVGSQNAGEFGETFYRKVKEMAQEDGIRG